MDWTAVVLSGFGIVGTLAAAGVTNAAAARRERAAQIATAQRERDAFERADGVRLETLRRDTYAGLGGAALSVLRGMPRAHEVSAFSDQIAYLTDDADLLVCAMTVATWATKYEDSGFEDKWDRDVLKAARSEFTSLARASLGRGDLTGDPDPVERVHGRINEAANRADRDRFIQDGELEDLIGRLMRGEIQAGPATPRSSEPAQDTPASE